MISKGLQMNIETAMLHLSTIANCMITNPKNKSRQRCCFTFVQVCAHEKVNGCLKLEQTLQLTNSNDLLTSYPQPASSLLAVDLKETGIEKKEK